MLRRSFLLRNQINRRARSVRLLIQAASQQIQPLRIGEQRQLELADRYLGIRARLDDGDLPFLADADLVVVFGIRPD